MNCGKTVKEHPSRGAEYVKPGGWKSAIHLKTQTKESLSAGGRDAERWAGICRPFSEFGSWDGQQGEVTQALRAVGGWGMRPYLLLSPWPLADPQ